MGNSNKLTSISDASNNKSGYPGGGHAISYDINGNITAMPDKGITQSIAYNFLNLPTQIKQNTNTTTYLYRADGTKLKKTYNLVNASGSKIINTEYLDGFQYSTPNTEPIRKALEETDDATMSARTAGNEEAFLPLEDRLVAPGNPDELASVLSFFPTAEGYYDYENFRYIYQYKDHLGNVRVSFVKNSAGGFQVMDTNDYYPFGMSFLKPFGQDSMYDPMAIPYNYKYNGKELQETGFVSMDYRHYAPDIGRFISQDRISEIMPDWTPYRFAFNNPVYFSDPTGLFEKSNALATCPNCPNTPEFQPFINDPNTEYFYDDQINKVTKVGQIEEVVVGGGSSSSPSVNYAGVDNNISSSLWWTNTAVGAASAYTVYKGQYHLSNEFWRYQPTGKQKVITPWSKTKNGKSYWNNPFAKTARLNQLEKVKGIRNISSKLTKAGGVLLAADIVLSGEIKPSHIINGAMLGASTTGVGAIVAGAWFIADFGTMGANYLINGKAKGLGDMLDESVGTYEMYDGVY